MTASGHQPEFPLSTPGPVVQRWDHEDQFRPPSLTGGCRLGKATFAGIGGKEEDAPIPVIRCG
jgi:hypothetical protein